MENSIRRYEAKEYDPGPVMGPAALPKFPAGVAEQLRQARAKKGLPVRTVIQASSKDDMEPQVREDHYDNGEVVRTEGSL